jgi:hypothetical protein
MKEVVQQSTVTGQPSASTCFDLESMPGEFGVFSWDSVAITREEDSFFKIEGKIEDQPRSSILFKLG